MHWTDELPFGRGPRRRMLDRRGFVRRRRRPQPFRLQQLEPVTSSPILSGERVTAVARCLLLLQNSLQISGEPDRIRNHPCVEGGHVGIGVVVDALLTTAAVSDDAHQHFRRGVDDERVTAQGRTQ